MYSPVVILLRGIKKGLAAHANDMCRKFYSNFRERSISDSVRLPETSEVFLIVMTVAFPGETSEVCLDNLDWFTAQPAGRSG
jgi:hypothetical protein